MASDFPVAWLIVVLMLVLCHWSLLLPWTAGAVVVVPVASVLQLQAVPVRIPARAEEVDERSSVA